MVLTSPPSQITSVELKHRAAKGHADLVKLFIEKGCDINALIDRDTFLPTNSFTPLTMAEVAGHKHTVAQLIKAGADPKKGVRRTSKGSPRK